MKNNKHDKTKTNRKSSFLLVKNLLKSSFLLVYGLAFTLFCILNFYLSDKIIYNVYVKNINIGLQTPLSAITTLNSSLKVLDKIVVKVDGIEFNIYPDNFDFKYQYKETVYNAFQIGRGNFSKIIFDYYNSVTKRNDVKPEYYFDNRKLDILINDIEKDTTIPLKEPRIVLVQGIYTIDKGQNGKTFDKENLKKMLIDNIINDSRGNVDISTSEVKPTFTFEEIKNMQNEYDKFLSQGISIKTEEKTWNIKKEDFINLTLAKRIDDKIVLSLDTDMVKKLIENISLEVNRSARAQILEINGQKAVNFVNAQDGLEVDIDSSVNEVISSVSNKKNIINLVVKVTKATKPNNEYNIEELIGVGKSRFKGSISSRVHNIGLASSNINGSLVAPNEEFSFVKAVGKVDKSTGYTPAYVISAGRTVLGDGGGVCQVSTTLFRAALDAGLPITARTSHSYRVGYYEQDSGPGIDATIYQPSVDLKFKNDTGNYILVVTEFDNKNLTLAFKLYGKKDGRTVKISDPVIHSKYAPPSAVYEEDPSLPIGVKKQIEYAVWGANVSFTRIVIKDNKEYLNDTFKSNYRAWSAVYKVGTRT